MSKIILTHDVDLALKAALERIYNSYIHKICSINANPVTVENDYSDTIAIIDSYAKVISVLGLDKDIQYGMLKVYRNKVIDSRHKYIQLAIMKEDI